MNENCIHNTIDKDKTLTFCKKCGNILSLQANGCYIASIKPAELNAKIEIHPNYTIKCIQNQAKLVNIKTAPYLLEYCHIRLEVIKQMRGLVKKYYTGEESYHLALLLADYMLVNNNHSSSYTSVSNTILSVLSPKIVVQACFALALKFLEPITEYPGLLSHLYDSEPELKECELVCLNLLEYKLDWMTPYGILEFYLGFGIFFEKEIQSSVTAGSLRASQTISVLDKIESAHQLSYNILNFVVSDLRSLEFRPEHIVFSIIAIVRDQFKVKQKWHPNFIKLFSAKFEDFEECYKIINK